MEQEKNIVPEMVPQNHVVLTEWFIFGPNSGAMYYLFSINVTLASKTRKTTNEPSFLMILFLVIKRE